jgi:hypothetical protein
MTPLLLAMLAVAATYLLYTAIAYGRGFARAPKRHSMRRSVGAALDD